MTPFLSGMLATLIVSIVSFVGILTLTLKKDFLKNITGILVSISAGTLIGDALFHLLPHLIEEHGFEMEISIFIILGILIFFVLEKFMHWHHCHDTHDKSSTHVFGKMNLIGDGLHNFLDGIIIGASFMADFKLGVATTIAIVLHEIPQEISDFGVLLHSGFSKSKALFYNFLSAIFAMLGTILVFIIGSNTGEEISHALIPITIGGFLYIALSDLIPELHKETKTSKSITQFIAFIIGLAIMYFMLHLEGH